MKTDRAISTLLLIALAISPVAGCRNNDPWLQAYVDLTGAELRRYEDRIYELEYETEVLTQENFELKQQTEKAKPEPRTGPRSRFDDRGPGTEIEPKTRTPSRTAPKSKRSKPIDDEPDIEEPQIDSGESASESEAAKLGSGTKESPKNDSGPSIDEPSDAIPDPEPPARRNRTATDPKTPSANQPDTLPNDSVEEADTLPTPKARRLSPDDQPSILKNPKTKKSSAPEVIPEKRKSKATSLYLNPIETRGFDEDRNAGDDGIIVVIEPRNHDEDLVSENGPVTVVLIDPTKTGSEAKVARWQVSAADVAQSLNTTRRVPGAHLRLPWLGRPPQNGQLKVFVRLETSDGRKLDTQGDLFVQTSDPRDERWTANDTDESASETSLDGPTGEVSVGHTEPSSAIASRSWNDKPLRKQKERSKLKSGAKDSRETTLDKDTSSADSLEIGPANFEEPIERPKKPRSSSKSKSVSKKKNGSSQWTPYRP